MLCGFDELNLRLQIMELRLIQIRPLNQAVQVALFAIHIARQILPVLVCDVLMPWCIHKYLKVMFVIFYTKRTYLITICEVFKTSQICYGAKTQYAPLSQTHLLVRGQRCRLGAV